jgi:hypothetical protein
MEGADSNKKPALLGAGCGSSPLRIVSCSDFYVKENIDENENSSGDIEASGIVWFGAPATAVVKGKSRSLTR